MAPPRDHISCLPDCVLSYILGFLPILEAVRTCILSHRWFPLWKSIPNLNFKIDLPGKDSCPAMMTDIINHVLSSHGGNVNSCLIECVKTSDRDSCDLIRLIQELIKRKNTQKLGLKIREFWDNFPLGLFSYKTLHILELNDCMINDASPFNGNSNLNLLSLTNVELTGEVFHAIISNCSSLKKLNVHHLYCREKLLIINDNLKFLDLKDLKVDGLVVRSKSLNVIVLDGLYYGVSFDLFTPNYRHLFLGEYDSGTFYYDVMKNAQFFERCFGSYKRPTTAYVDNIYENLLTLSIALDLNDVKQAFVLSFILRMCVSLRTLYIKEKEDLISDAFYTLPYPEFTSWERHGLYDSVSSHLRRLELTGFRGDLLELAFLKHIIANGRVMDMLVVCCDENGYTPALQLLSLPKASSHLSVVIKPSRSYALIGNVGI